MKYICPRCGEQEPKYIGYKNNEPYCRRCIRFKGEMVQQTEIKETDNALEIKYSLTKDQRRISTRITKNYIEGVSTLVKAVCGAGKTELVYGVMSYALSRGHTVGFAIPRRDVVIELEERIRLAFPKNKVASVYGGHHDILNADIVVLTTHQIYRYHNYFDLLIMDEVDAFPFVGDQMLFHFAEDSVRKTLVMMSATPDHALLRVFEQPKHEILELNTRYHGHSLPVPKFVIKLPGFKFDYLVDKLDSFRILKKPVLVFVPTIQLAEKLYKNLKEYVPCGNYVHSKRRGRQTIINDFKHGQYRYLVTTAVLERGVTIKNLQVIIYDSDHEVYTKAALVQISGRAGRKYDAPEGEVIFLSTYISNEMEEARKEIESRNMFL
ncbi:MAG: DEAD/DEAH box helicase family protein [Bacilli bacterium]|nr:DEAD/DEAH box helicase family protein [Bacilli bacterium]